MTGLVSVGGVKLGPECQALAWAREFHAATRDPAGKYHREAILKGIDL